MVYKNKHQKGFSMIEVLVTVLIMGIGLLALAVMQVRAMKGSADSGQRSKAVWLAQEMAERIHANPTAIDTYRTQLAKSCAKPTKLCSDYFDQSSGKKHPVTSTCNSTELATFDVWELACGYSNSSETKSNLIDFLNTPKMTISCSPSPCTKTSDVTLTTTWQGRSSTNAKSTVTQTATLTFTPGD